MSSGTTRGAKKNEEGGLSDNQNRLLCPPFRVLDSKEEFPLYYEHIKSPIDMKMIAAKIRSGQYTSWQLFESDIRLMCRNAKAFNEPSSTIHKDASKLQAHCLSKRDECLSRKITSKEMAQNREIIDELLQQETAHSNELVRTVKKMRTVRMTMTPNGCCTGNKSYYPDYYDEIEKPMSLFMINKRLKQNEYPDLKSLVEALLLVFRNARSYNIEESDIYKAANQLEQLTLQTAETLSPGLKAQFSPIEEDPKQEEEKASAAASSTEEPPSPAPKPVVKRGPVGRKPVKRARLSSERSEQGSEEGSSSGPPAAPPAVPVSVTTTPTSTPAKRRRPARESSLTKSIAEKQKPGRKSLDELREKFTSKLMEVWNVARDLKMGNRVVSDQFYDLPCEKKFPDYYTDIAKPMSMTIIKSKIEAAQYVDSAAMIADFALMCNNARQYNRPDSQIFTDSTILESVVTGTMNSLTQNNTIYYPYKKSDKNWSENASCSLDFSKKYSMQKQKPRMKTPKTEKLGVTPSVQLNLLHQLRCSFRLHQQQQQQQQPSRIPRNVSKEQQQMHSLLDALITFRDSSQDGRVLSEAFMKLPSRAEYPEYYDVIRKPMDLARVRSKLQPTNQYDSLKALVADLNLVFDNACKFNEPDSQIYKDALTLQKELLEMRSQFYEESNLSSVQTQVRLILTNLLVAVTTYKDSSGRCLCDCLGDVHDLLKKAGVASEDLPFSMDEIKNNVDKGRYRRLDRFQEDLFALFSKARQFSEPDSVTFNVAVDLQLYYLEKRDELCKGILISPASLHLRSTVLEESENLRKEKRLKDKKFADTTLAGTVDGPKLESEDSQDMVDKPKVEKDSQDEKEPKLAETEELDSSSSSTAQDDSKHIMRIEHIIRDKEDKEVVFLKGTWCYKPGETYHKATRMFYPKEVFLTPYKDTITVDRLKGKCCVMFVDDYLRRKPANFSEADTYVCESRYLGRKLHFKRLPSWPYPDEAAKLRTEDRKEKLNPTKVVSEFVAGVPEQKFQATAGTSLDNIYYQQMEYNGQYYRLGDGVMVFREGKPHCEVMRIDKMWQTPGGQKFFSGCVFARPKETKHEQSRMFYKREVIAVEQPDKVEPMSLVQNKCAILTTKTFETSRPTEIPECDVFVVDQKVFGLNYNQNPINNKNCSLVAKYSEAVGTENVNAEAEMSMQHARTFRKLKPYNLSSGVIEDEIYYFKTPLILEKELSPQIMSDTSLPIDHSDLDNEAQHINETIEQTQSSSGGSSGAAKGGATWLAAQPKLNAKSKSGYILFSAEVRKKIMSENPESGFGEVSKIVGIEWKKLPEENKRQYEIRAHKLLQPGQIRVFSCRWQLCDYQFDSQEGLYEHIKSSHTCQIIVEGDNQYVCLWTSCLKYRKEGKPFPSMPRLHRHIKEKHLASSSKPIFPNQKSKHFFVYLPPQASSSSQHSSQQSGHFVHQPYGVPSANAVGCSVATPISSAVAASPSSHGSHHQQPQPVPSPAPSNSGHHANSTAPNGYASATHYVVGQHHQPQQQQHQQHHYATSSASSSQHHTTVVPVSAMAGGSSGSNGNNGVHHQQLVQATINGNTVYVPAGAQYQTYVLNQPNGGSSQAGAHQIVVHQSPAHMVQQQHHPSAGGGQMQHVTYVQHNGGGPSSSSSSSSNGAAPVMNGLPPGASYVTAPAGATLHLAGQPAPHTMQTAPNSMHHLQQHPAAPTTASSSHQQGGAPAGPPTLQPMMDAGRTVVKRVMHSEAYVKYIESLYNSKQKTVSKWDKNLLATNRNTTTNHKKLPYDWIKHATNGNGKPKEEEIVKSLWKLREQLLQDTTGIKRNTADQQAQHPL
uniref:Protein polybromo-1 n=1 Tax=Ditylenchus dipsaci TaxID=166011 RepID=A0A915DFK5_9BILA